MKDKPLWWVDFIEGELPPKEHDERKAILRRSPTDRQIAKNLLQLRELIQTHDPAEIPKSQEYHSRLKDQIMSRIEDLDSIENRPRNQVTATKK
jgi:hypothetical protein